MILLSLLLFASQPDRMLLSCDDYDWLVQGVFESSTLTPMEKLDFILRFADGTDPSCFNRVET